MVSIFLAAAWFAWFYPFAFRAPHYQKRESITVAGPTRIGLLCECAAIGIAAVIRRPVAPGAATFAVAAALAAVNIWTAWSAVRHLGRQFRVHAGLYHDHQLVRTGPYRVVRHPIYASLLGMLIVTILLVSRLAGAVVALALFVVGTEIRVHSEDALLAGRFGEEFERYRRSTAAYLPFVR